MLDQSVFLTMESYIQGDTSNSNKHGHNGGCRNSGSCGSHGNRSRRGRHNHNHQFQTQQHNPLASGSDFSPHLIQQQHQTAPPSCAQWQPWPNSTTAQSMPHVPIRLPHGLTQDLLLNRLVSQAHIPSRFHRPTLLLYQTSHPSMPKLIFLMHSILFSLSIPNDQQYIDIGATSHMTINGGTLSSYFNLSNTHKITVGNGLFLFTIMDILFYLILFLLSLSKQCPTCSSLFIIMFLWNLIFLVFLLKISKQGFHS